MKITLGTTYFENPNYLLRFLNLHLDKVDELIIVDDYSTNYPALKYIPSDEKIKLYRVTKNYGFNSHGCRNLIMNQSKNDWVCLIDIDREFHNNGKDLLKIYETNLEDNVLYKFPTHFSFFGNGIHQSVNDFIIHKNLFNSVGGYDEEFVGYRTGDRQLFAQISNFGFIKTLLEINLIYTRAATEDIFDVYNPPKKIKELVEARIMNPDRNKKNLTFCWERVM